MTTNDGKTLITETITRDGEEHFLRRVYILSEVATGKQHRCAEDSVTIGSANGNTIIIGDPRVSRHHARIEVSQDGVMLRDLRSTNGTFVNGLRIEATYLPSRAHIRVGNTELEFRITDECEEIALGSRSSFGRLAGGSVAMRRVYDLLERATKASLTVLIHGESGTGKELAAEAVHMMSERKSGPFVVVDCGSLPPNLIESELFGHEVGAFTGATHARAGVFEQAHGGTLMLDEIGELPLALQSRLLRVLDSKQVKRVGGAGYVPVDVRVVAATHRDLEQMVATGDFRSDLYYRLSVLRVALPPLRHRVADIPMLAERFLEDMRLRYRDLGGFELTGDMLAALQSRSWYGNVRELRNVIERAAILRASSIPAEVPAAVTAAPDTSGSALPVDYERPYAESRDTLLNHFEREYIRRSLDACGGNMSKVARESGIDRSYVFRLMRKHQITRASDT